MRTRFTALAVPLVLLAACSEQPIAPTSSTVGTSAALAGGAPKFWETGATVAWNELADRLLARRFPTPALVHTYLSLAQFKAAEAAAASTNLHPPISAAIGGASAAVLSANFPLDVADIEAALDAQEAADPWPGAKHEDFAAGEAIGRAIGARVLAYRQTDLVGLANPGTPPVGPGSWIQNGPIAKGTLGARPFYLSAADEAALLPPPPPAFGSPEFNAALAEIRQISDTRTAEQTAIAVYWHVNQGPFSAAAWNGIVRDLIVSHHKSDAEAARIFFLGYSAVWDALLVVGDGKFHYWTIRPSQADPGIIPAVAVPNHPSYPSNHAGIEGAWAGILEAAFPDQVDRLEQIAEEGSISRLYAGIHYRFDKDVGLAIGRAAAAKALAADLSQVAPLP
jgi:PAP2 superfamily protein